MDDVNIMSREKNGMDVIDHNRSKTCNSKGENWEENGGN